MVYYYTDLILNKGAQDTTHLSKTFKSSYGVSISQYKLQQRLMRTYELVLEGKLSIYQVAAEVGYKDQSSFTRAFKGYFEFYPPTWVPVSSGNSPHH